MFWRRSLKSFDTCFHLMSKTQEFTSLGEKVESLYLLPLSTHPRPRSKVQSTSSGFYNNMQLLIPQLLKLHPYLPCFEWEKLAKLLRFDWRNISLPC